MKQVRELSPEDKKRLNLIRHEVALKLNGNKPDEIMSILTSIAAEIFNDCFKSLTTTDDFLEDFSILFMKNFQHFGSQQEKEGLVQ